MRGGTASCTVICADGPIGSPVVDRYQVAALLNAPSAERFLARVAPGGIAVVNADLVGDVTPPAGVRILRVPCTSIGRIGGDERMTAIVALGALVAAIDEIDPDAVETALRGAARRSAPASARPAGSSARRTQPHPASTPSSARTGSPGRSRSRSSPPVRAWRPWRSP